MLRRMRRLLVLLVVFVVVVVAVVVVLGNRSALDHARSRIDTRWSALRGPLETRYRHLAVLAAALTKDLGRNATLPSDLAAALKEWGAVTAPGQRDAAREVVVADRLEGLGGLARVTARSSDRLKADQALQTALVAFDTAAPPRGPVDTYNAAVRSYEHDRTTGVRHLTAAVFGYDARRTFEPAAST